MRNLSSWAWAAALVLSGFCGPVSAAPAAPGGPRVDVKVAVTETNDYHNIAGSAARSKQQSRQLRVTLGNWDKVPIADVSAKWVIYARKMDSNKVVTVKQGTVKTKLGALSTITVKSDKVTMKGTPKHTVVTKKNVKGKVQSSSKNNPATGEEYYGYSVAVYAGTVLIEEISDPASLKPKQK